MLRSRKRLLVLAALAALAVAATAAPAHAEKRVVTRGGLEFVPNKRFGNANSFRPGTTYVKPNEVVKWRDRDRTIEPHTITVVNRPNLPKTVAQIIACPICDLWKAHLEDPEDPSSPIAHLKVDVSKFGFQREGDSLYLENRARIGGRINAPIGKTIHYMCAFHPWMQGKIVVTRSGKAPRHHHH